MVPIAIAIVVVLILVVFVIIKINPYILGGCFNKLTPMHPEFIETDREWCKILRDNYEIIRDEYINYIKMPDVKLKRFRDIDPYQTFVDDNVPWNVVILRIYNKDTKNIKYFPKTRELVSNVPNCSTIMFSIINPGQFIRPHRGPYRGILRYHLGLLVPKQPKECNITVNDIVYNWETGKDVIFDDTHLHSVVNNTDETRVVLFLDVKKEFNNVFLNVLNSLILYFVKFNNDISTMVDKT